MSTHEADWNQLVTLTGDSPAVNKALLAALNAYQERTGCLPGGYDREEWNDIYRDALANYRKAS